MEREGVMVFSGTGGPSNRSWEQAAANQPAEIFEGILCVIRSAAERLSPQPMVYPPSRLANAPYAVPEAF